MSHQINENCRVCEYLDRIVCARGDNKCPSKHGTKIAKSIINDIHSMKSEKADDYRILNEPAENIEYRQGFIDACDNVINMIENMCYIK